MKFSFFACSNEIFKDSFFLFKTFSLLSSGSGFFNTIFWVLHFIFNCQQNPYSSVAVSSSLGGFSGRFFKANKSFSFGITLLLSFLTPFSFFFLFFLDVTSAAATFPSFLCFFLFYQLSLKLIIFSFLSGWCGLFFYGTATTFFLFITLLLVEMVLFLVTKFFFLTLFLDESVAFYFFPDSGGFFFLEPAETPSLKFLIKLLLSSTSTSTTSLSPDSLSEES